MPDPFNPHMAKYYYDLSNRLGDELDRMEIAFKGAVHRGGELIERVEALESALNLILNSEIGEEWRDDPGPEGRSMRHARALLRKFRKC